MNLKAIIRKIAPPILLDLYRTLRHHPTWEGVYPHISAVPATPADRRGEGWLGAEVDPTRYSSLPLEILQEHNFLAVITAVICSQNGGSLRVLDFGGGLGISYAHLRHTLPQCAGLDYHIVELEWACREGSRLYAGDRQIHFHRSLPEQLPDLDLIHLTESLEYIEDYGGLLKRLCTFRATYVLIVGLHAGPFATYATAELNIPGTVIPQWFLNLDEIVGIMAAGGYPLIFRGATDTCDDQRNFPEELRVPGNRPSVLLFARSPRN